MPVAATTQAVAPVMMGLDIFDSLTFERKAIKERLKKKQEEEAAKNPEKAAKLSKVQPQQVAATYSSRKSRGLQRVTYNEGVTKIPGLYNETGKVEVKLNESLNAYDFMNLTALQRTSAMQS
jgi:hypothetical protein